jgi:hypothetical protein
VTVTLIGSRAVSYWYKDARLPRGDWDYHSDKPLTPGAMSVPPKYYEDIFIDERLGAWKWGAIATPNELYTMKISHSFWDINGSWDKHAHDIIFLQRKGAVFNRELYDILLPIWKERYKRNPTNLHQSAATFFSDAVNREYDHDSLHESIAYGKRPLYESILQDGSEVAVDNAKFFNGSSLADHQRRIRTVREEIYATALERILIPNDYKGSPAAAYAWALKRTATSLFKGEWALYLLLNLDELMKPDCDYLARHLSNRHMLRPYKGK